MSRRQQQTHPQHPYAPYAPYAPHAPYGGGPPYPGPPRRRRRSSVLGTLSLVLAITVPLVVGGIAAFYGLRAAGVAGAPDALSADGLDGLREDVRERSGGTEVFEAVVYPDYAVVEVPVDGRSKRAESLRWDGGLDDFTSTRGTADTERIDLADVDAEVVVDAVETAKSLVEDPDTWYVIIRGPSTTLPDEDGPTITAHASNDFDESVYVEVDLRGKEVRRLVGDRVIERRR